MINVALGVISGFSEFSEFLFRTDGKTLSDCKIIPSAISTTIFFLGGGGGGGVRVPVEAIERKHINRNVCIF